MRKDFDHLQICSEPIADRSAEPAPSQHIPHPSLILSATGRKPRSFNMLS